MKAAAEIPLETIRTCIEQWPERLRRCIEKEREGGILSKIDMVRIVIMYTLQIY